VCLIVDVNVAHKVLLRRDDEEFGPVSRALFASNGPATRLYYVGKLRREYAVGAGLLRAVATLDRAGRAKVFPDGEVDRATEVVMNGGVCVSDDHHIIGLARVSGGRLLCTADRELQRDFTNPRILNKPRGNIYQRPSHAHLLKKHCKGR
jgi:hypothetical protein